MPIVNIPTSFNINLAFDAPGLGRRTMALLIDMLVQYLYIVLAMKILDLFPFGGPGDEGFNLWAIQLILFSPVFLYHILMEISTNGLSIGKRIMNLRVVSLNGGRLSISQFLIRWLLRISDLWIIILAFLLIYALSGFATTEIVLTIVFGIGFFLTDVLLVANSKKAQRIGDILAQTIVIKTNTQETLDSTVFREVATDYVPLFPQVMHISDRDLNAIKNLLSRYRENRNDTSVISAAEKVKKYLQIESAMSAYDFLDKLLMDYNFLSTK